MGTTMYYLALASDYDGTIAEHGAVDQATFDALCELKRSGRRLILVSGRELPDLQRAFPELELFDLAVLENGGLLYEPATRTETVLGEPPPAALVERLQAEGVEPLSVGRCIVATWTPHEHTVLAAIRELGLELQIIFNKGAVMVLPPGVNKASGLHAALERLGISAHNVVGVGDAENDHAFLAECGVPVAVANALPALKEAAEIVTEAPRGAGVAELVAAMLANDLDDPRAALRRRVPFARPVDGGDAAAMIELDPRDGATLIAGISGGGKSTIATTVLERFVERGFQFCVIDPEGDYGEFKGAVVLGDAQQPPALEDVVELLGPRMENVVVNLLGFDIDERPGFLARLLPEIQRLRAQVGRPQWLLIDEAHHMFPREWVPAEAVVPECLPATLMITVHPESLAPKLAQTATTVLAVGSDPKRVLEEFAEVSGKPVGEVPAAPLEPRHGILWRDGKVQEVEVDPPKERLKRHVRKYAQGDLGPDRSFYFRGPDGKLNLRANNLMIFLQIAEGVDDETWLFHLQNGDYARWFEGAVKDDRLAKEVRELPEQADPATSRRAVKEAIERLYTVAVKAQD
ncbi:HAD family hydrolase [Geminicoccus flavidas]|uniref:HAD-IIB family hydrolase n=1 Tax=Geminicoccus flavidas TaxID=2506407 RepID=UPI00190FB3DF|nr:HAD-IIB family hydrolase [Geminicoccus flavidas]